MPEGLFRPEGIDIRHLIVEAPKEERSIFDPERDVSPEVRQFLLTELQKAVDTEKWQLALKFAGGFQLSLPNLIQNPELKEKIWQEGMKLWEKVQTKDQINTADLRMAVRLKLLFPDRVKDLELIYNVEVTVRVYYEYQLEAARMRSESAYTALAVAQAYKILFPSQIDRLRLEQSTDKAKETLALALIKAQQEGGNWEELLVLFHIIRELYPDIYETAKPSPEIWAKFLDMYDFYTKNPQVIDHINHLHALSADEIVITDTEYRFVTGQTKSLPSNTTELPEQRKY